MAPSSQVWERPAIPERFSVGFNQHIGGGYPSDYYPEPYPVYPNFSAVDDGYDAMTIRVVATCILPSKSGADITIITESYLDEHGSVTRRFGLTPL